MRRLLLACAFLLMLAATASAQTGGTTGAVVQASSSDNSVPKHTVTWFVFPTGSISMMGTKAVITFPGGGVTPNAPITGATKTKITYDSKGLVISGADATKTDVGLGNVDNTSDANKPVSTAQQTALNLKQNSLGFTPLNPSNNLSDVANAGTSRMNLGATTVGGNLFTATNPSAISFPKIAADNTVSFRTPAQVLSDIGAQASLGFTPENSANKDATGGYAGLTLFKINFKNAANTFISFFTNANTATHTYTFQNRDGTIADDTDLAGKIGGTLTSTRVPYASGASTLVDDSTFTFNSGTKALSATTFIGALTGTASGNEVPLTFSSPLSRSVNTISFDFSIANTFTASQTVSPSAADAIGIMSTVTSSANNVPVDVLKLTYLPTGTSAAGAGPDISFSGKTTTITNRPMANIAAIWTNPTQGSQSADLVFKLTSNAIIAEVARITSAGNITATAFNGLTITANGTNTLNIAAGQSLIVPTGGTIGSNAYTSTAYAPLDNPTFTTNIATPAESIGFGATAPPSGPLLAVATTISTSPRGIASMQFSTDTNGARVGFFKARGSIASPSTIVTGDTLGRLMFRGYVGATNTYVESASIEALSSGTVADTSTGRLPSSLVFSTSTDASPSVLTTRLTIDNTGLAALAGALTSTGIGVGQNGGTPNLSNGAVVVDLGSGTRTVDGRGSSTDSTHIGLTNSSTNSKFWAFGVTGSAATASRPVGSFFFYDATVGGTALSISGVAGSPVNHLNVVSAITNTNPIIQPLGTDSNIGIDITGKGTGGLRVTSTTDSTTTTSGALQVAGGAAIRKRVFIDGITASSGLQTAVLCQSSGGEMIADSVACLASSMRFKENIFPLGASLDTVMKLRPISFNYKPEGIFSRNANFRHSRVGFLAEEVNKIDSRFIGFEADGITPRSVSYETMTALLTKAMQEMQSEILDLRARLQILEAR